MRLKFLDRDNEKTRLTRALARKEGTFCCLYGRRRCGKSRLLQKILPAQKTVYFVGDERESTLQRDALASAVVEVIPGIDAVNNPQRSRLHERWWREAPSWALMALED